MIEGVKVTPLKIIETDGGNVMHAMKNSDPGFTGYGEAYFSIIEPGKIKAWKKHKKMTLNLVVPVGEIQFVIYDDRNSEEEGDFQNIVLSRTNYCRLTVPPGVWMGFMGLSETNAILLNIADIPHDPNEVDRKNIDDIRYEWSGK